MKYNIDAHKFIGRKLYYLINGKWIHNRILTEFGCRVTAR